MAAMLFNDDFEYGNEELIMVRQWMSDMMEGKK